MKIYEYGKSEMPALPCTLAIGIFDGVHIAHRELIGRAVEYAKSNGIRSGVFTFSSKNRIKSGKDIYTLGQRLEIIEKLGVDFCIVADFSDIRNISPEDFCRDILVKKFACRAAVVGYNFRFGKEATGNSDTLLELMRGLNATAIICPEKKLFGTSISSTAIRAYLESGEIKTANAMLGEEYYISGAVVHGRGIGGKRLGSPTANIQIQAERLSPRFGVYAARALVKEKEFAAAVNVGTCPTYIGLQPHAEAYIIGCSDNLYGEEIKLSLVSFLREEQRFFSENELKKQIEVDINAVLKELKANNE